MLCLASENGLLAQLAHFVAAFLSSGGTQKAPRALRGKCGLLYAGDLSPNSPRRGLIDTEMPLDAALGSIQGIPR